LHFLYHVESPHKIVGEEDDNHNHFSISEKFKALLLTLEFLLKSRTVPTLSKVREGVRNISGYDLSELDLQTILSIYPNIVEVQWITATDSDSRSSSDPFELSVSAYTVGEQRGLRLSEKNQNFE